MEHDVHHPHHHHQMLQLQQQQAMDMELPPGFRFHPTDEELITHYLARKAADPRFAPHAVGEADLNKCEPWDLPARATMGEKEWYFFCVKDRKYPTGLRTNRATESGYWKATGKDREIFRGKALVGMKKTLVFYTGRAPKGGKTGWVMHEYRLHGKHAAAGGGGGGSSLIPSIRAGASKDEWVLCRVFKKSIEPPFAAGGNNKRPSGTCMEVAGVVGPSTMSMAADDLAACALPPLMDVSGGGSGGTAAMSLSAAGIELPAPAQHVTCFSNALEGPFLNPPFLLPSAGGDHLAMAASSASPFLATMIQAAQYDAGASAGAVGAMVHELLQEGGGGWYGKLAGETRERLSGGASQDTGLTSEVNPGEISSARQHMDHEASLWGY